MSSLAFSSALDLAQQIRQKQLSPLEVTQFFLQRIQHLDSQLGSFVHIAVETAIATAQSQTEELAQCSDPSQLPPFFGVPIGIKDLNAVVGMPIGYGVAGLPEKIAQYDEGVIT
ncbi:MAG: amidase family protein, partial [Microcystaceae cyanobacterium]